ncbi:MAG: pyridoxine 5'-phosphate synthase [Candidatus Hydrogenedens sp.]|nr:pyridoxine 5'-phosphate synthase [Candidatus Hydrogenedens sp.]
MIELGVNIDHVATLRQARREGWPKVVEAARVCEDAGAHQITVHLRQDRRHIQDHDIEDLAQSLRVRMNFEMAAVPEMIALAHRIRPHSVCLVPESREEITTEGGLDVAARVEELTALTAGMHERGILVSMFIDPDLAQVEASAATGADMVELHTGQYANAAEADTPAELERLRTCGDAAVRLGMLFNAGHGLSIRNLAPVAALPGLHEVNIGHDIISRAIFIGLDSAVKEILAILQQHAA